MVGKSTNLLPSQNLFEKSRSPSVKAMILSRYTLWYINRLILSFQILMAPINHNLFKLLIFLILFAKLTQSTYITHLLQKETLGMALTKANLVDIIAKQNGFSKNKASKTVGTLLEIIKKDLENGEDVLISGFGKFCVKEKGERKGRNPATGGDMMLAPRRVVTFKCSGKLRDRINRE